MSVPEARRKPQGKLATRGTAIANLVGPTWKGLRESFSYVYPGPG
jgi:hypothetical protein